MSDIAWTPRSSKRSPGASPVPADRYGAVWSVKPLPDGRQVWARTFNGTIVNGGINPSPRTYHRAGGPESAARPRPASVEGTMTEEQAYTATFGFLDRQFQHLGAKVRQDEELVPLIILLGDMSLLADGLPADPPITRDWRQAIDLVAERATVLTPEQAYVVALHFVDRFGKHLESAYFAGLVERMLANDARGDAGIADDWREAVEHAMNGGERPYLEIGM